jgi:dihydrofolate reductase
MNLDSRAGAIPEGASRLRPNWIAIAAIAENRIIGSAGRIPWHLPADFAWFKKVTAGQILLMGRKTYESIGRPLPGRRTIVVSRSGFQAGGVEVVRDLAELSVLLAGDGRRVFLCGGGELYREWLGYCGDLLLTHVKRSVEGDAVFPPYDSEFAYLAPVFETAEFRVVHYTRRSRNTVV